MVRERRMYKKLNKEADIYIYIYEKKVFYMALANCRHMFRPYFGPHQYSVNQL